MAETQLATHQATLNHLEQQMLSAWTDKTLAAVGGPNYGRIVGLRAEIEDFPRVRKHLKGKVEAAKQALKEFERNNAS